MLAVVLGVVALLLVFAIAAAVVGRETHRLVEAAPRPVFDLEEAVAWVAAALPFEVSAQLSHDDVRRLLLASLDHLDRLEPSARGSGPVPDGLSLVAVAETVDAVLAEAREAGIDCTREQVHEVVDAELGYLQAIGAMGPPEQPQDDPA